ncbi:MAG: sigma factor-like helix-turn-helix DNA-binding protein [Dehalococcoidia bacterium]|nr:sigma factor-like helix-turn-helix DNA-binding protein [Dehalococcoidia bacterium]
MPGCAWTALASPSHGPAALLPGDRGHAPGTRPPQVGARPARAVHTGTWLRRPLFDGQRPASVDPAALNEGRETLSLAFLFLLERLSPVERAVFVLHEAFDYRHREIARSLDISEAASRQHLRRARTRLGDRYPVTVASREQHERTGRQLVEAVVRGDIAGVVSMLAEDAAVYSDGGGVVAAAMNEVHGALRSARLLAGIARKTPPERAEFVDVNGVPGVLVYRSGRLDSVMTFELDPTGHVRGVYIVRNPRKLGHDHLRRVTG